MSYSPAFSSKRPTVLLCEMLCIGLRYINIEKEYNESVRRKANQYVMEDRLGKKVTKRRHCVSKYLRAEDGHKIKFCPDCGYLIPENLEKEEIEKFNPILKQVKMQSNNLKAHL